MKSILTERNREELLKRPEMKSRNEDERLVRKILKEVKELGDSALIQFAKEFDGFNGDSFKVDLADIQNAKSEDEEAIRAAFENIQKFHEMQKPTSFRLENTQGVTIGAKWQPLGRIGFTIPGGTAPLVSTVLMLGVPALIAGVREKVLITPAKNPKEISMDILFAAKLCEVEEIYCVGGAQGIAALAYGTDQIKKVDKIVGPGSYFVDQAKRLVSIDSEGAAIDMPAGPSEVLVLADEKASPRYIAADLLAQLEHGIDSQAICVSNSSDLLEEVEVELQQQARGLTRFSILKESINNVRLIKVVDIDEGLEFSEGYAPEHLILQIENPYSILERVSNAGSVFLGPYTPETLGDYMSGTNHVLPTSGFARSRAGLGLTDFMRKITYQFASKESLEKSENVLNSLCDLEGLDAHKNAVTVRLESKS